MVSTVEQQKERAVLAGVELKRSWPLMDVDESLAELGRLAATAGVEVVGRITQRVDRFDPATFMGSGKVDEVQLLVEELEADLVIFDDELSPRHQRELEGTFGEDVRLLDRTALILDIFAQHARTREGQLQVELAQLEYRLPRLTRMWTHLARQAGGRAGGGAGGVGLRGPGETQLESDRRMIGQRIGQLKTELDKVRAHRSRHRERRQRNEVPVVAIVGYTNAGKSTLLNQLSGANVLAANQLFATLDPTTRRVTLPGGHEVLFTDTVGFIQKLPTMLVAAFRATLEEIAEADTLLHVVDATHPQATAQMESVQDTLAQLQVETIPTIVALNKVDRLDHPDRAKELVAPEQIAVPTSGLTGYGLEGLLEAVEETLVKTWVPMDIVIPYQEGTLVSIFHDEGAVDQETHTADGVHIVGRIPVRLAHRYEQWKTPALPGEFEEE
jgi:GTP-binding protein HflX